MALDVVCSKVELIWSANLNKIKRTSLSIVVDCWTIEEFSLKTNGKLCILAKACWFNGRQGPLVGLVVLAEAKKRIK